MKKLGILLLIFLACWINLLGEDTYMRFMPTKPPFELLVSMGKIDGFSYEIKFAENPDIDTGSDPEDIWDFGGLYTYTPDTGAVYYFSSSAVADSQICSFKVLTVDSLSGDWNIETIVDTVQGQTRLQLETSSGDSIVRIFRIENLCDAGDDITGIIYVYESSAVVDGVPSTDSRVRAIITNGNNQTLMSQYAIPSGYVGFFHQIIGGMSRSIATGAARVSLRTRRFRKVFKVKGRVDFVNSGSSNYYGKEIFPQPIPAKTDINLRVEEVTANNTGVFARYSLLLVREDKFSPSYLREIGQPGY